MARHIEVWHDETSDSENALWCVSLCEEDGSEVRCLSTHDEREEAEEAGREEAATRDLRACYRETHGAETSL